MIKKCLAVAVILLFIGVAFALPINANVNKSVSETKVMEEESATPIALVFQLIIKLRNHKDMQELLTNTDAVVDFQKEISSIVERDKELNLLLEEIKRSDCGCDEERSDFKWFFPVICTLLVPFWTVAVLLAMLYGLPFGELMAYIGLSLNCYWI